MPACRQRLGQRYERRLGAAERALAQRVAVEGDAVIGHHDAGQRGLRDPVRGSVCEDV